MFYPTLFYEIKSSLLSSRTLDRENKCTFPRHVLEFRTSMSWWGKKEIKSNRVTFLFRSLLSSPHLAVASAAMKWFLSAAHLFPPSFSSLFRIAARVSLRGTGWMGPMGGTEKFRLGAGSQVACTPPVHLPFLPFFYLVARLFSRSTLRSVLDFHRCAFFSSLSIYHCLSLSLFRRRNWRRSSNSFLHVRTNGIDSNLDYRRIAADTRAPRGYPAGTVHRMSVYKVYRHTHFSHPLLVYGSSSSNLEPISSSQKFHTTQYCVAIFEHSYTVLYCNNDPW